MKSFFAAVGIVAVAVIISSSVRYGLPALGYEKTTAAFWGGYVMGIVGGAWFWYNLTS